MNMISSIKSCFSKYATWKGRAPRSEFWWYYLFVMLSTFIFMPLAAGMDALSKYIKESGYTLYVPESIFAIILIGVFLLVVVVPFVSVSVRRLHDKNKSAWWLLLFNIPILNLILLVFWISKGTLGKNDYGADPLSSNESQNSDLNNSADTTNQKQIDPDAINKLFELFKSGAITQAEFDKEKSKILS